MLRICVAFLLVLNLAYLAIADQEGDEKVTQERIEQLVQQMRSGDFKEAKQAEEALIRLGPNYLPVIRHLAPESRLVQMHDKLQKALSDRKLDIWQRWRMAIEAIDYFEECKGVKYIAMALKADTLLIRDKALKALCHTATHDEKAKKVTVEALVYAMKNPPSDWQDALRGSDEERTGAVVHELLMINLAGHLIGVRFDPLVKLEEVITQCEKWLYKN